MRLGGAELRICVDREDRSTHKVSASESWKEDVQAKAECAALREMMRWVGWMLNERHFSLALM
jgi:hypothetical protein